MNCKVQATDTQLVAKKEWKHVFLQFEINGIFNILILFLLFNFDKIGSFLLILSRQQNRNISKLAPKTLNLWTGIFLFKHKSFVSLNLKIFFWYRRQQEYHFTAQMLLF